MRELSEVERAWFYHVGGGSVAPEVVVGVIERTDSAQYVWAASGSVIVVGTGVLPLKGGVLDSITWWERNEEGWAPVPGNEPEDAGRQRGPEEGDAEEQALSAYVTSFPRAAQLAELRDRYETLRAWRAQLDEGLMEYWVEELEVTCESFAHPGQRQLARELCSMAYAGEPERLIRVVEAAWSDQRGEESGEAEFDTSAVG